MNEVSVVTVVYNGYLNRDESRIYTDSQEAEEYMIQKIKDWLGCDLDVHDENAILEDGYFRDGGFYITINEC